MKRPDTGPSLPDGPAASPVDEPSLIAALRRPGAFAHPVDALELRQTHLSLVFLAGDRAYKVKRAVDLGFVDFRELDARRRACADEVRLNSRLAPSVYLGVSSIVRTPDDTICVDDAPDTPDAIEGVVVDWAVRMVRIADESMLDRLLAEGAVRTDDLDALADLVVGFLRSRPRHPETDALGTPEAVARKFLGHLDRMSAETTPDGEPLQPDGWMRHLHNWTTRWLAAHETMLRARSEAGHVREGHGDLHAGNIALVDGSWLLLDCVEFRRDFRCLDSVAEVAVLTMDIAHRAEDADLARRLRDRIADGLAEPADRERTRGAFAALHRAYAIHYAAVRAHVVALRATADDDPASRERQLEIARQYLHHAVGLTMPQTLIVMCGLPGSGKSVVARAIGRSLEGTVMASDRVRKELAGLAPTDRSGRAEGPSIYTAAMDDRTLAALCRRATSTLATGASVVIDATNATRGWRDAFAQVAKDAGIDPVLLWLDIPDTIVRDRLRARVAEPDQPSDADESIFELQRTRFERPDEWPLERLVPVIDPIGPDAVVEKTLAMLKDGG